jgi:hypothetical protein
MVATLSSSAGLACNPPEPAEYLIITRPTAMSAGT